MSSQRFSVRSMFHSSHPVLKRQDRNGENVGLYQLVTSRQVHICSLWCVTYSGVEIWSPCHNRVCGWNKSVFKINTPTVSTEIHSALLEVFNPNSKNLPFVLILWLKWSLSCHMVLILNIWYWPSGEIHESPSATPEKLHLTVPWVMAYKQIRHKWMVLFIFY